MIKRNVLLILGLATLLFATPTTQIWNPATDVQAAGTYHIGIDSYFVQNGALSAATIFPTDLGLEYGVLPGLEVGLDMFLPNGDSPLALNAKYALAESKTLPVSVAVGVFGFGIKGNDDIVTDTKVFYGLLSKNTDFGRLSAGAFLGNSKAVLNAPDADNKGIMLTWDKAINDKLWVCVDYAGSKSQLGYLFAGFSWAFSSNTSVIVGYGLPNNTASQPLLTTQLDINL